MDITKYFINFCKASQFVYGGENYIDVYKQVDGTFKKTKTFENKPLTNLDNYDIDEVKRELGNIETGIVLNSAHFIFNIFEFDKIPFREEMRKDLVTWRLQKVFPEDIGLYDFDYFRIDKKKMLSILFKKAIREKIEEVFEKNGMKVIYIGNSTVEILNKIRKLKPTPDFLIEIDRNFSIVIFLDNGVPFYIRKFRSSTEADIALEIVKTVNFAKSSYNNEPSTYSLVSPSAGASYDPVREQLAELKIKELSAELKKNLFLPE